MIAALLLALAAPNLAEEPRFGISLGYTALGPAYGLGVEGVDAGWAGRLSVDERSFEPAGGGRRQVWSVRGTVARRFALGPAWLDLGAGWRGRGLVTLVEVGTQHMSSTTIVAPNGPELAFDAGVTAWSGTLGKQSLKLGLEAGGGYAPLIFFGSRATRWGALAVVELGGGRLRAGWQADWLDQAFDGPVVMLDFR
ncbi:MAG: hypothetical protein JWM80_2907 [Cyanobacteria bacterium RYN_339]|nr:hypothetical protein [Cyanobacteria bacterium RYN_339]